MIVRCENCKEFGDLKTRAQIEWYINGGALQCPNCKAEMYYKKEK